MLVTAAYKQSTPRSSLLDAWHMELFEQHESSFYAFNSIAFLREDTLGVLPIPSLKSMTGV